MEELSKFVIESFESAKIETRHKNQLNTESKVSNATPEECDKADDNESIDIDITDLSNTDESKSSTDEIGSKRISVIKRESREKDKRVFCININKNCVEGLNLNNNCVLKTRNWLLTESFKENKPQKYSKVNPYGK